MLVWSAVWTSLCKWKLFWIQNPIKRAYTALYNIKHHNSNTWENVWTVNIPIVKEANSKSDGKRQNSGGIVKLIWPRSNLCQTNEKYPKKEPQLCFAKYVVRSREQRSRYTLGSADLSVFRIKGVIESHKCTPVSPSCGIWGCRLNHSTLACMVAVPTLYNQTQCSWFTV